MVTRYLTLDSQHVHPSLFKCSVVITLFSVWCNFFSVGNESFCWGGREKVMLHKRGFLNNKFVKSRSWPICFLRGGGRNIFICLCILILYKPLPFGEICHALINNKDKDHCIPLNKQKNPQSLIKTSVCKNVETKGTSMYCWQKYKLVPSH